MKVLVSVVCVALSGCFEGLHAPRCRTLADCPVDQGYTSCEDGYCLRSSGCNQTAPIPGDGCCPPIELDRTGDTDCLVLDVDLGEGTALATPAADAAGSLFVAGVGLDPAGGKVVMLWKVSPAGAVTGPVTVGPGSVALPALVSRGSDVYVAFQDGVMRYAAADLSERAVIPSATPVEGLAATGGNPLQVVAWPAAGGRVILYDETGGRPTMVLDLADVLSDPDLGSDAFLAPVVSGSGRRLFVATAGGRLIGIEVGANPLGPTAYRATDLTFVGPPVEWAGRVFVAAGDGTLRAYRERDHAFEETWSVTLDDVAPGPLLVDDTGAVIAVLRNGDVVQVRDRDTSGEPTVVARLGDKMADWAPLLTSKPRLLAVTSSRGTLVSAWEDADGVWHKGLRFDLPSAAIAAPTLSHGRVLVATASGHVAGWALSEDLPVVGFPTGGGDAGNARKVLQPVP